MFSSVEFHVLWSETLYFPCPGEEKPKFELHLVFIPLTTAAAAAAAAIGPYAVRGIAEETDKEMFR